MHSKNFYVKVRPFFIFTFLLIVAAANKSYAQSTSWKGTVSTAWATSGNWTNGVPSTTKDAVIGDASFTGAYQPAISASANTKSLTIGGSAASTLSVNKNLTISGDLTINSNGTMNEAPIIITIKGNWANSGTYTADSLTGVYATATFAGTTTQTISGSALSTFMKLTVSAGASVTLNTDIRVVASTSISGTFNPGEPVKMISGDEDISVGATGTLKVTAAAVAGNYSASAISLNAGSTVDYSSTTTSQTIWNATYYTLKISGSGVKSLAASLPSLKSTAATYGNILVEGGTLDLSIYSANRGSSVAGGTLSVSAGAVLMVGGTRSLPTSYATYTFDPASTVQYSGTNQTVNGQTFGHLILSSSGGAAVKTMPSSPFTVAGNFTSQLSSGTSVSYTALSNITFGGNVNIGSGTSFTAGSYSFGIAGNWVNNGTFAAGTSTVTMSGTSAAISGSGTHSFSNLTFSGSGITSAVSLITVTGDLLTTGSGTFTHAATKTLNLTGTSKTISTKGIVLDTLIITGTSSFNSVTTNSGASITEIKNITLSTGGIFDITNQTLKLKSSIKANGGRITASSGKVEFFGTSAQSVPASVFTSNAVKDLTVSNAAGVTLNGAVSATGIVGFGNVNSATLTTNGYLTLVSTSTTTAAAGDVTNGGVNTGNSISGNVTVERYFTAKRAYRFLTSPVNTSGSIKTNWMENTNNTSTSVNNNPVANYGTHITGTGGSTNGFDQTVLNSSTLFTFSNSGQAWTAVANTSGLLAAGTPYRILIRGSRSTDLNNNAATPSVTTVRAKGTLVNGTIVMAKSGGGGTTGMPVLTAVTNAFSFVGNPYASAVDWNSVEKTDVTPTAYIFDPTISGTNGRGAYVSYNASTGNNSNLSSFVDRNIQSGESFFIITSGSNPSLTFRESHKTSAFRAVFRTQADVARLSVQLLLPDQVTAGGAADGLKALFSDDFDDALGYDDSYKFTNQDENIAIVRGGKSLSIEGRKSLTSNDTLPLKVWQLLQSDYNFKITSNGFAPNVKGYLEDAFLRTSTPLVANGETAVPFTITSDAASFATDRFKIIFNVTPPPAISFTGITAVVQNKQVEIQWTPVIAKNTDRYEVEKSTDLKDFHLAGSVKARNSNETNSAYSTIDLNPADGENYYRIKTVSATGEAKYSAAVKVLYSTGESEISAAAASREVKLSFKNMQKGTYTMNLLNMAGQVIAHAGIMHDGGASSVHTVALSTSLPAGIYKVQVTGNRQMKSMSVFVSNQDRMK